MRRYFTFRRFLEITACVVLLTGCKGMRQTVEVPVEVEKVVTRDTVSHLENTWAQSDAVVSGGFLHHSLESKPQIIRVPVEIHVTDTLYKASEIVEKTVEVEKPLSWAQRLKIRAFWWLLAGVVALSIWTLRKIIF